MNIDVMKNGKPTNDVNYRGGGNKYQRLVEKPTLPRLDCNAFRDFWYTWDYSTGTITVGEGRDPSKGKFFETVIALDRKSDVRYIAVGSPKGVVATYRIYNQCPKPAPVEPPCKSAADCKEKNHVCGAGKCVKCAENTMENEGVCKSVCLSDKDCDDKSACDTEHKVCNSCPDGTAPRLGVCAESCTSAADCDNAEETCNEGFCDKCGDNELIVEGLCVDVCTLKRNWGDCTDKTKRYFFKKSTEQCLEFDSCVANGNNFATEDDCAATCSVKGLPDECLLKAEPGDCEDFTIKYYYDEEKKRCKKFQYGGCGGNKNLFPTKDDCREHCARYGR